MSQHILLVEAESELGGQLGLALVDSGFECSRAVSVASALDQLQRGKTIDAVVADYALCAAGRERGLLAELRQAGSLAPIVVTIAHAAAQQIKFALNEGAAYLLEKPITPTQLIAALALVLARSRRRHTPEQLFERARLTRKERAIARHLLKGHSGPRIAQLENNSPRTIRQHISCIYAKCAVGSRAEFLRTAYCTPHDPS